MSPRHSLLCAALLLTGCRSDRIRVIADVSQTLPTSLVAPHPALRFVGGGATAWFDTAVAFPYFRAQLSDTTLAPGWRQRFDTLQDAAQAQFAQNHPVVDLRDEYVVSALLQRGGAAVFDHLGHSWAPSLVYQRYAFTCGALCGERHSRFRLPDGRLFLDVLDGIS